MSFDLAHVLRSVPESGTVRDKIEYIDIDRIEEDPNNFYELSGIEELAANIELVGLQQPLRVRAAPDHAENVVIVSGHRRRAAVRLLVDQGHTELREIPCIRDRGEGLPALQELRLIYANRDTRVMTGAEMAQQAFRVQELLYELKEAGYNFPGRMRDHVAEACKISKSRLSRLKVIDDKLDPVWRQSYEASELAEDTAYKLARLPAEYQVLLHAGISQNGKGSKQIHSYQVEGLATTMAAVDHLTCPRSPDGKTPCGNRDAKLDKVAHGFLSSPYDTRCGRCCAECDRRTYCKAVCPLLKDELQAQKEQAAAARDQIESDQRKCQEARMKLAHTIWTRTGIARRRVRMKTEACILATKRTVSLQNTRRWEDAECGGERDTSFLPFGYIPVSSIQEIIAFADFLGCSVDYLLGRSVHFHTDGEDLD